VERRALDRVSPAARLAAAREQVGLLFDRATRAVEARLARERFRLDAAAIALPRHAAARLTTARVALEAAAVALPRQSAIRIALARSSLDTASTALAVLGPSATLERGYAIVRREPDGLIVRDPVEAGPGTGLRIRVAHGDVAATVDDANEAET
jgi:exodeoxyribonuclease VII large subunit